MGCLNDALLRKEQKINIILYYLIIARHDVCQTLWSFELREASVENMVKYIRLCHPLPLRRQLASVECGRQLVEKITSVTATLLDKKSVVVQRKKK